MYINSNPREIATISLKGGAGKSFVSANLGKSLTRLGFKVGFLDIDVHNPGLHRALGYSSPPPLGVDTEIECIIPSRNSDGSELVTLASHFLENSRITWEGKDKSDLVNQMLGEVIKWDNPDYLIIDSPPGQDECIVTLFNRGVWGSIIVLQPSDFSAVATVRVLDFIRDKEIPLIGLIENMSGVICPECGKSFNPFISKRVEVEEFAKDREVPFIGKIPFVQNEQDTARIFDQIVKDSILEAVPRKLPSGKVRRKFAREVVRKLLEKKVTG